MKVLILLVIVVFVYSISLTHSIEWKDDFHTYNSSIWIQSEDVEHCESVCFQARKDHLLYNQPLPGSDKYRGLIIKLNQYPCNILPKSCCQGSQCAKYAAGHLRTQSSQHYGTYSILARTGHNRYPDMPVPNNLFTCYSASYVDNPVHNEVTMCWNATSNQVHFGYWYNELEHETVYNLGFDASKSFHEYSVVWAPDRIDWFVDGKLAHRDTGVAYKTIPWEAGQAILILRPKSPEYDGDGEFDIGWVSYSSKY